MKTKKRVKGMKKRGGTVATRILYNNDALPEADVSSFNNYYGHAMRIANDAPPMPENNNALGAFVKGSKEYKQILDEEFERITKLSMNEDFITETSDRTGMPVSTLKTKFKKILKRLKNLIDRFNGIRRSNRNSYPISVNVYNEYRKGLNKATRVNGVRLNV